MIKFLNIKVYKSKFIFIKSISNIINRYNEDIREFKELLKDGLVSSDSYNSLVINEENTMFYAVCSRFIWGLDRGLSRDFMYSILREYNINNILMK